MKLQLVATCLFGLEHMLGEEIARSEEIKNLEAAKAEFDKDADLQSKMKEYETERILLAQEFSKEPDQADQMAISNLKARLEELSREINTNKLYQDFANAQKAMNELMNSVNAEIKFCITGERPSSCTHDCSTCGGCAH